MVGWLNEWRWVMRNERHSRRYTSRFFSRLLSLLFTLQKSELSRRYSSAAKQSECRWKESDFQCYLRRFDWTKSPAPHSPRHNVSPIVVCQQPDAPYRAMIHASRLTCYRPIYVLLFIRYEKKNLSETIFFYIYMYIFSFFHEYLENPPNLLRQSRIYHISHISTVVYRSGISTFCISNGQVLSKPSRINVELPQRKKVGQDRSRSVVFKKYF